MKDSIGLCIVIYFIMTILLVICVVLTKIPIFKGTFILILIILLFHKIKNKL